MSNARTLISYDDITLPYSSPSLPSSLSHPNKKRKTNKQKPRTNFGRQGSPTSESRELTHEEIWDDRALIEAWEAATNEYEVLNGPGKEWKNETVARSALWYNMPRERSTPPDPADFSDGIEDYVGTESSRPLDFSSFTPKNHPSLDLGSPPQSCGEGVTTRTAKDVAFQRALDSMYWTGYWTAVYQYSQPSSAFQQTPLHRNVHCVEDDLAPSKQEGV